MDDKNELHRSDNEHQAQASSRRVEAVRPKRARVGKGMLTFLMGILVGVALMGLYTIGIEELKHPRFTQSVQPQAPTAESTEIGKDKITEEELNDYVVAKDCSTLSSYSTYTMSLSRLKMMTISLEESVITAGREGTTNYIRWMTLPTVVDSQCKEIKLTDVQAGDLLNVYTSTDSSDLSASASDTRMIQRVNK